MASKYHTDKKQRQNTWQRHTRNRTKNRGKQETLKRYQIKEGGVIIFTVLFNWLQYDFHCSHTNNFSLADWALCISLPAFTVRVCVCVSTVCITAISEICNLLPKLLWRIWGGRNRRMHEYMRFFLDWKEFYPIQLYLGKFYSWGLFSTVKCEIQNVLFHILILSSPTYEMVYIQKKTEQE